MSRKKYKNSLVKLNLLLITIVCIGITSFLFPNIQEQFLTTSNENFTYDNSFELENIPNFSSEPYVVINENEPEFSQDDFTTKSFEKYSELDFLGRCGIAFTNLSIDTMPSADEERESISSIEPSGWINKKYDIVDGGIYIIDVT